jgi:hypothetical protein
MSTLVAQTISNGTVSTSSENVIQGSAKAWASWNGTNGAIRGSYNVSSVTRNSTGSYTVNFTNAMVDANYSIGASGSTNGSQGALSLCTNSNDITLVPPTTTAFSLSTAQYAFGKFDSTYVNAQVFR